MKIRWIISTLFLFFINITLLFSNLDKKNLKYIIPLAEKFVKSSSNFSHYIAYKNKRVIGICYISTDIISELSGYNGPISILIGLMNNGTISGIKVIKHTENIKQAYNIEKSSFESQFKGKNINDPFNILNDIDNISGATITTKSVCKIVKQTSLLMHKQFFKKNKNKGSKKYFFIFTGIIFLVILLGLIKYKNYFNKKRVLFYILTGVEISLMIIFILMIKQNYYINENFTYFFNNGAFGKIQNKESKENISIISNKEEIILNPKWGIQKADKKTIKKQIISGNLSDKEADNYKKVE